jgi:hypothetical protein
MKLAMVAVGFIGLLCALLYATGALMLLFKPYAQSTVQIADRDLGSWKSQVRTIAQDRGGWFREKSLDGHWGGGELTNRYTWRQFGYCNFSECVVLSNPFKPTDYNVVVYENRFLGRGESTRSYLKVRQIAFN